MQYGGKFDTRIGDEKAWLPIKRSIHLGFLGRRALHLDEGEKFLRGP